MITSTWPSISRPRWILQNGSATSLKGACSHHVNKTLGRKLLYWQNGYGVVSFGKRNLSFVLEYIRGQREHHAGDGIIDRLERIGVD